MMKLLRKARELDKAMRAVEGMMSTVQKRQKDMEKDIWKLSNPPKYKPWDMVWAVTCDYPEDEKEVERVLIVESTVERVGEPFYTAYKNYYTVFNGQTLVHYHEARLHPTLPEECEGEDYKKTDDITEKINYENND